MKIQRDFWYIINIAFQISKKKIHYTIINVRQPGSYLESNKIDTKIDVTSSLIFGSPSFPGNTGDCISQSPNNWAGPCDQMWPMKCEQKEYVTPTSPADTLRIPSWFSSCYSPARANARLGSCTMAQLQRETASIDEGSMQCFSDLPQNEQERLSMCYSPDTEDWFVIMDYLSLSRLIKIPSSLS